MPPTRYFFLYKPYLMLPQFSPVQGKQTLANIPFKFPKDVYPVGRLDADSEGLLLLTNDTRVNHRLLNPDARHPRAYLVQVEGEIKSSDCERISQGVIISVDGKKYKTKPCKAEPVEEPDFLPERIPPIRFRKSVSDSWLKLTLTEGKNRQVRKMTASVGFPTLRLVRYSIGDITIVGLQSGQVEELDGRAFYKMLSLGG